MYYDTKESGIRVKKLRRESGLTQEQLADKLNITASSLSKIEIGNTGMSIDLSIVLAAFFHVSLDYVIMGRELQTDEMKKQIRNMLYQLHVIERQL